jgi:glucosyl-3-phosphoglycerate synthase
MKNRTPNKPKARVTSRIYTPFKRIVIPLTQTCIPETALAMAQNLNVRVDLLGLLEVADEGLLSSSVMVARQFRRHLDQISQRFGLSGSNRVSVSISLWKDLQENISSNPPDLLVMEWPCLMENLGVPAGKVLSEIKCNLAIVRAPWPEKISSVLVPVRGGPYAELALRLGLALHANKLVTLHLTAPDALGGSSEAPFKGLAGILPKLTEVIYEHSISQNPVETIFQRSKDCDVLVAGIAAPPDRKPDTLGTVGEKLLRESPCAVVLVKTERILPFSFNGIEGEKAGSQAISVLVDKWFAENTYHADEFDDLDHLLALKKKQGITISLALPALNEEETVGHIIEVIKKSLLLDIPLLDEIVLIDSNSTDKTRQIAFSHDIPVYIHQELLPQCGLRSGKGEALWKSLYVTGGDIIVWIDTDIYNIHPRFVYGVIGPLLVNPSLQFVKGFYQRPLKTGELTQSSGGGRVTELTARPLINLFYPELSGVIQPLAGEYGGRRSALEQLPFFSGYGVETGLLIDIFEKFGLSAIAQVDLLERIHRNQPLEALGRMSFVILQAVLRKLERRFNRPLLEEVNKSMKTIRYEGGAYYLQVQEVAESERPPMQEMGEYRENRQEKSLSFD